MTKVLIFGFVNDTNYSIRVIRIIRGQNMLLESVIIRANPWFREIGSGFKVQGSRFVVPIIRANPWFLPLPNTASR